MLLSWYSFFHFHLYILVFQPNTIFLYRDYQVTQSKIVEVYNHLMSLKKALESSKLNTEILYPQYSKNAMLLGGTIYTMALASFFVSVSFFRSSILIQIYIMHQAGDVHEGNKSLYSVSVASDQTMTPASEINISGEDIGKDPHNLDAAIKMVIWCFSLLICDVP